MSKLPWALLILAVAGIACMSILLLDSAVALDDARSEVSRQQARGKQALSVIREDWVGRSASQVISLSAEAGRGDGSIAHDSDVIEVDDLVFRMRQGRVTDVEYID